MRKALISTLKDFNRLVRAANRSGSAPVRPDVLLEIWRFRCDDQYEALKRGRLDWLGEVILGSMVDTMYACSYDAAGKDARELELALIRVIERSLQSEWPRLGG
jgi:hypothetical protein